MTYTFFIPGIPAPQGSKQLVRTAAGRTLMINANANTLKVWRNSVTACTRLMHIDTYPKGQGVSVVLDFVMPATLKDREGYCPQRPDLDKLARAVLDGLVDGGAMADDSQVVRLEASKVRGIKTGVHVRISEALNV